MSAALEHRQEAPDIGIDISLRMMERVADAGLRGEMDDALGLLIGKDSFHHLPVGKVSLDEMESVAAFEPREPRLFQRDIIIGTHIVEADHLIPAIEQPGRRMEPNEAGGAGDQNTHRIVLYPSTRLKALRAWPQEPSALSPVNRAGTRTQGPVDASEAARYRPWLVIPRSSVLSGIGECRRANVRIATEWPIPNRQRRLAAKPPAVPMPTRRAAAGCEASRAKSKRRSLPVTRPRQPPH